MGSFCILFICLAISVVNAGYDYQTTQTTKAIPTEEPSKLGPVIGGIAGGFMLLTVIAGLFIWRTHTDTPDETV